jgi:hypothetical protein
MDSIHYVVRRDDLDSGDDTDYYDMNHLLFALFTLLLLASLLSIALVFLRRRRLLQKQASLLPTYHHSHHRSPSITNISYGRNESVFVYDEKMNLIHNSSSPPSSVVPEIHITFPDEEGMSGQKGRVVVVHVTDSGSVGLGPIRQEHLPPYQQENADRFQSLDLNRIGGLREKEPLTQRFS